MYLYLLFFVLVLLYFYGTRNFKYWEQRNVKFETPIPFFGTVFRQFIGRVSISEYIEQLYDKKEYQNEKVVGYYVGNEKYLLVRDPELIKSTLTVDFHAFHVRGMNMNSQHEPLKKNLFSAEGDIWKLLRQRVTPAFTSGKLKAMFPLIVETAEKLKIIAGNAANDGKEVDIRELMARYTTDFIGTCGFGIDSDSLQDEDSSFRKLGKRIFTTTYRDMAVTTMKQTFPTVFKYLPTLPPEITDGTIDLVRSIIKHRNYKPIGRNDFIDMLLELREKGMIVGESIEKRNEDGSPVNVELVMDDIIIAAQVFIFFAAGFESSSSTSSFTLHQLAFHPEAQEKCQEEIDEVLKRHGGKLSYEAVNEMKYLIMCFRESMRILPALGFLSRECVKPYTLPGTDITIDPGVTVVFSVQGLQNDPAYFQDPDKFIPERFHPDNVGDMVKHTYIPFGEGPRGCIGERLGLMQAIAGLAALLSQFSVAPSASTKRRPIVNPKSTIVQVIMGGLPLQLVKRKIQIHT